MRNFLQSAAVVVVLAVVVGFVSWSSIMAFGVRRDLHQYGMAIRTCSCSLKDKERILDLIDELDERIDRGEQVSTLFWVYENENIRSVMKGGLTHEKLRLIDRELQKVRKKLSTDD